MGNRVPLLIFVFLFSLCTAVDENKTTSSDDSINSSITLYNTPDPVPLKFLLTAYSPICFANDFHFRSYDDIQRTCVYSVIFAHSPFSYPLGM